MVYISVIVPVYNGEKYLKKCLDSIVNQTLRNIEIICVNDGSTDDTGNILKKYSYKDERFKIITTDNNGQGTARNIALGEAKGEYISFIDSDDWIRLDSLELLYKNAKLNDLDILFFQMSNYIQDSDKFVSTELYDCKCFENIGIEENMVFNHNATENCLFEIPVGPVSKLYKNKFLENNNLLFPEGMFFEDNSFFYNSYFKCNKAGFLKEQLYYRRRHNESVTQTFDETKFDIVIAANGILDVFIDNLKYEKYKKEVINHTFSMLIEWFKKSPFEIKQDFYKKIKENFKGFLDLKCDFSENLNDDFKLIYECSCNNEFYLDFLSEYKLKTVDYVIYNRKKEFEKGTVEYDAFKSEFPKCKISVVIPIYNNEKYIHRTLMSIENQIFGIDNIEVLLIDDNSSDNTYEVIKTYCDKYEWFIGIRIKKGTGSPGTPRNIGLLEASSDYVIFMDHDDFFEIDALETLYSSICNFNCDLVYGTYVSIDIDKPTKIVYPNEKHGYFESIFNNQRAIAFPPPSIWTKLFKKDFLIENDILFPTILGEDAIFVSKALFNANGVNYLWDSIVCYHNLNKRSYTKNVSYNYLIEGFTSEEYMFKLYDDYEKDNFYKIRGEGILDFYLSQFIKVKLTKEEIIKIFPLLYDFTERLNSLGLSPHVNEENIILFNNILKKDIESILDFKLKHISKQCDVSSLVKKILKKVFR